MNKIQPMNTGLHQVMYVCLSPLRYLVTSDSYFRECASFSRKGNNSAICVLALQSLTNIVLARTILKEVLQISPSPNHLNLGNFILQYDMSS